MGCARADEHETGISPILRGPSPGKVPETVPASFDHFMSPFPFISSQNSGHKQGVSGRLRKYARACSVETFFPLDQDLNLRRSFPSCSGVREERLPDMILREDMDRDLRSGRGFCQGF